MMKAIVLALSTTALLVPSAADARGRGGGWNNDRHGRSYSHRSDRRYGYAFPRRSYGYAYPRYRYSYPRYRYSYGGYPYGYYGGYGGYGYPYGGYGYAPGYYGGYGYRCGNPAAGAAVGAIIGGSIANGGRGYRHRDYRYGRGDGAAGAIIGGALGAIASGGC